MSQCFFGGANNVAVGTLDEKDDESNGLAVFFCGKQIRTGELKRAPIGCVVSEFLEDAHDGHMMQRASCILSAGNL